VWVVGSGPAVVFLHGSGPGASGPSNFGRNAGALAAAGYRALLVDSMGYGDSSKPVDRPYTLAFMAEAALTALTALGVDRATFVGNSQGGAQALWIALEHPERVDRLVLMAPGGLEEREVYMGLRGIRAMMKSLYSPPGPDAQGPGSLTRAGLEIVLQRQVFDQGMLDAQVVDDRWEAARQQPLHVFQTMQVPNLSGRLGELSMPVLALWGMDDVFCPPSGAMTIATSVPNARVTLFTRCGHWVMVEHADTFNRLLVDFLAHG
jgi:4,5:9,10-diseco-3-hydroxy-5,9,17-trioxoandrosta-1(10),2-diene-4-oate hydrolase